jgi:flavin reductase (DIM6/NTAB) family NADH-FMN oxidoreductase RutF
LTANAVDGYRLRILLQGEKAMNEQAKKTALLMLPYGLQVLGAKDGDKMTLATVNWTTQCSFKPPQVVVGIKGDATAHGMVKNSKAFALSFLGTGQKGQAFAFFKHVEPEGNKMGGFAFETTPNSGCPIVSDAPAWVECKVIGFHEYGDHSVVVGEVVEAGLKQETEPLTLKEVGAKYGG